MAIQRCVVASAVIHIVSLLMAGVCLAAPFFAKFEWSVAGASQPTWETGFLIADRGDKKYKFHLEWCDSSFLANSESSKSKCDDAVFVQLIMSIILFLSFVFFFITIILIFCKPKIAFVFSPLAFTFAAVSLFVYILRFLPNMRDTVQAIDSSVSASWTYDWTGYIFFAFIVISFVGSLLLMIFNKQIQRERQEVWREKEIAAAERERKDKEKSQGQQNGSVPQIVVDSNGQSMATAQSPTNSNASGSPRIHHGHGTSLARQESSPTRSEPYYYASSSVGRDSPPKLAPAARPSPGNQTSRPVTPPVRPYGE